MRSGVLALCLLAVFSATSSAQVAFRPMPPPLSPSPPPAAEVGATPDQVVARLMSFDRDGDRRVTKEELAERLENLVEQADASGDGFLDEAEIRSVAEQPTRQVPIRGFQAGHYGFADDSTQSSRFHLERSLDDLRLASPVRENAAGIVLSFAYELDQAALADLLEDLGSLLAFDQFRQFRLTLTEQDARPIPIAPFSDQVMAAVFDLERQIEVFRLPEAEQTSARLALDRFKSRLRTTDGDRSVLLGRLQLDLTEEQRDDLRAALARRSVAKGAGIVGGGVIIDSVSVR